MYEETLYQKTKDGTPFVEVLTKRGIIPGIKVDKVCFIQFNRTGVRLDPDAASRA
jgi:fructose-bisphosphate aldolase class 1